MRDEEEGSTRARLARRFSSWTGLDFGQRREDMMDFAQRRAAALGRSSTADYLHWLEGTPPPRERAMEIEQLLLLLNISETYFLRAEEQLHHLVQVALPRQLQSSAPRRLRLLSAGCASGEEAYSLAITLLESPYVQGDWSFEILAFDLDERLLARAREGIYSSWSLRQVPASIRARHFTPVGSSFRVTDEVRAHVTFIRQNLVEEASVPGPFDAIFCRNVLMYLNKEGMRRAIAGLERALSPGGLLYLGHAESLRGLGGELTLVHEGSAFCYHRGAPPPPLRPPSSSPPAARAAPRRTPPPARVPHLRPVPVAAAGAGPESPARAVLSLVADERLIEAAERIESWAEPERRRPAHRRLLAAILAVLGDTGRAELLCHELLEEEPACAETHFVLALCQESRGEWDDAIERVRMALELAPGFAIARFHLGRLLRQTGRQPEARAELVEACARLVEEDPDRVTLYGGGFPREVLVRLCHGELRNVEVGR